MNFVVFRNKPGFSFIILFAAFLFIASITIGTVRSSASSNANSQTEKTDVSVDDLKNFSKDEKSGRMSLKSVSHSEENIADSPIFDQFNAWLSSYSDGNFTEAADQLEIGKKLAIKRQELLKQLIKTNPRLALEKSIPAAAFKHLPAEIAEHSEKRVSAYGDFMVYVLEGNDHHTKEMTESRIERFVVIGDDRYEAFVYGRRESMPTKMNIPLQGIIIGDQIALDESPARKIDDSENTAEDFQSKKEGITAEIGGKIVHLSGKTEFDDFMREQIEWESKIGPERPNGENALASAWTEGQKSVLVIRVIFSTETNSEPIDHYNRPLTLSRAQGLFANEVNPFYVNNSYNKTSLAATVTPVVRLPQTQSYYATGSNYNMMLADARTAARAAGYDTSGYTLDIVTFSYTSSIGWAGIAAVGGKANMLNGAFYLPETAHELGHNFGLLHANLWQTNDGTSIGAGGNNEYGDCYDNMGACYNGDASRHFNARYKRLLNWLTDANIETVTATGTYRIFAHDSPSPGGIRALKIAKGTSKNYWVEFRQAMSGNAKNGALIRWDYGSTQTQVLDMNPSTAWTRFPSDEPLAIGQSFYDSTHQIKITVLGKGGTTPESLDVKVELNTSTPTPSCSYAISPGSQSFNSTGGTGSINVTATSGCAWTAASNQSFAAVTSGGSGSGSGVVNYSVAANSASSTRSATLTVGGQTFTVQQGAAATPVGTYTLVATPSVVAPGGAVAVNFTAPAGSSYYDWVGLFKVGDLNTNYINGGYTNGGTSGVFNVTMPAEAGQYEFRYLLDNGYTSVITSNTVTVQSVSCSYSISPASQNLGSDSGTGSFGITTGTGCSWTTSVSSAWLTISSAASGTGSGTVSYAITANTGAARSGTITIAGQTLTVNQAGATTVPNVGLQYYPLAYPIRLLDTRSGAAACYAPNQKLASQSITTQPASVTCQGLTIPSNAAAVVGTAIALNTPAEGHLRLYPAGEPLAEVSNVNFAPGRTVSNSFTVKLGTNGAFNIYSSSSSDVVMDVTGYYAAPGTGGLYYHQLPNPIRILETRPGEAGYQTPGAPLAANSVRLQQAGNITYLGVTIPASARAITGNATVVNNGFAAGGTIKLYPGDIPDTIVTENINYVAGQTIPNAFNVRLDESGKFKINTSAATHVLIDVTGYYSTEPAADQNGSQGLLFNILPKPFRLLDTRAGETGCDSPAAKLLAQTVRVQTVRGRTCSNQTIPSTAKAIFGNATVVNNFANAGAGNIRLYPGEQPLANASNLNYVSGDVMPNSFIVGLGTTNGAMNIWAFSGTDFIVDVSGYFAP